MRSQIIQIGNSQGIRIPKMLLEDSRITGEVELELHPDGILIKNVKKARSGWAEAFKKMSENDDDELDSSVIASEFDQQKWQW
jgi:antitoxin MazE